MWRVPRGAGAWRAVGAALGNEQEKEDAVLVPPELLRCAARMHG